MSESPTTIFVITVGDGPNFRDCMDHLRSQSVQRPIALIDHVAPLSLALQEMHDRCATQFYIQVDEDMLLSPDAVERLETCMRGAAERVALVCAPLWDCDTERPIYGLKIYRHAIASRFPYENSLSCETRQVAQIESAGFACEILPLADRSGCFGEHGKHYSEQTIFKRWQRLFQKQQRVGMRDWIDPWARKLLDRYLQTRSSLHLYAFLGAVAGITGDPAADRAADYREPNEALARIERYFPTDSEGARQR